MKKIIVSVLITSLIIMTGCKSGGGDPKLVLLSFFDAILKKDVTAMKKYSTKDSETMLNMVAMGMQNAPDSSGMIQYEKENIEVGNAVITGDKAIVPVKEKKSGETTDFTLKKESGDWKVAFDKSTLMEMAQKKMKEGGMMGKMRDHSMQGMDSVSKEDMQKAQMMMDSASKMLNDTKESDK
jgi:hypothetical protein